jgi:hypothetical protein
VKVVKTLMTVPGIGSDAPFPPNLPLYADAESRVMLARTLYDAGCDTIEKLDLKRNKQMLTPKARTGLKYLKFMESPIPRENAERFVVRRCLSLCLGYEFKMADGRRNFASLSSQWITAKLSSPATSKCVPYIQWSPGLTTFVNSRRDAPTIGWPIEILIVYESATDPIPTPPHPSTLKLPHMSKKPTRLKLPFVRYYMTKKEKATSRLLSRIVLPLVQLSVVSDTICVGVNSWRGWLRVPTKRGEWESKNERFDGIRKLVGDFHRVNITYVPPLEPGLGV